MEVSFSPACEVGVGLEWLSRLLLDCTTGWSCAVMEGELAVDRPVLSVLPGVWCVCVEVLEMDYIQVFWIWQEHFQKH